MAVQKAKHLAAGVAVGTALLSTLVSAGAAYAGSVTKTASIPETATDWSTAAEVGQFDPSLGTLESIGFGLTGTLRGSIGVESLEPTPSAVSGNISSEISLSAPGAGQVLSVAPSVAASANLATFDGKIDFAGKSGRTFSLSSSQSATTSFTAGAGGPQLPVAPFVGTGKVALPVTASATSSISGPLDLAARTRAAAGAKVTVQYGVGAAPPPAGGYGTFGSDFTSFATSSWGAIAIFGARQTATQTRTLSDQGGDWTRNVTFDPFDRALGTLESANLTISGDVKASLSVQNTGSTTGSYNVDQSVAFDLLGSGGESLDSTTADATRSGSLNPFAGTDNFSRPFGTTIDGTILGSSEELSDGYAPDLDFFSGADPLTLSVEAIGSLSAELPGSADLLSTALEGAEVTLSYTYLPNDDPPSLDTASSTAAPEPGSLAVLLSAITGFGLLRRRRR